MEQFTLPGHASLEKLSRVDCRSPILGSPVAFVSAPSIVLLLDGFQEKRLRQDWAADCGVELGLEAIATAGLTELLDKLRAIAPIKAKTRAAV